MKENGKNSKGITLISLVVTIILLLILAGVTLSMLAGDNGILTRTKTAREKHEEGQAQEETRLGEMEGVMDQYLDESGTGGGESAVECPEGKTLETLAQGDDITIGTEKFKVYKTDDNNIYAMPYYNITLTTDNPVQSSSPGTIAFCAADDRNWTGTQDIIDMTEKKADGTYKNNIQQYIDAYSSKLNALDSAVTARVARYSEMSASGVTASMRNPGYASSFWLGSSVSDSNVRTVDSVGSIGSSSLGNYYYRGVRPVIVISKS